MTVVFQYFFMFSQPPHIYQQHPYEVGMAADNYPQLINEVQMEYRPHPALETESRLKPRLELRFCFYTNDKDIILFTVMSCEVCLCLLVRLIWVK